MPHFTISMILLESKENPFLKKLAIMNWRNRNILFVAWPDLLQYDQYHESSTQTATMEISQEGETTQSGF
ncbi:hypothetical protein Y1Q_0021700 [Alligator mississippiensis]|uniref:Uncharacterized protein n=1 Tax=Alligator mississippiensis TaxID=8496 RepID=A0A151PAT0_ALLMI|nr:hypothetical protein Y1Q_0021700 [Alligator mississippiensis]